MFWNKDSKVIALKKELQALNDLKDKIALDMEEAKADKRIAEEELDAVKRELVSVKSKKVIEEEKIKHLIKMKEEANELRYQKREMALNKNHAEALADVKDNYQEKLTKMQEDQHKEVKEMYSEIIQLLPNVNVRMKGEL